MATNPERSCSERKSANILFLGEVGIGKTTLIHSYLRAVDRPVQELGMEELYIFAIYPVEMKYKEHAVDVGLIDLYPGSNSPERRHDYPTDVSAIVLCFSVGHLHTLSSLYNLWIHEARAHYGKRIPVFLVGLRSDVRLSRMDHPQREETRIVEKMEAETIHRNCDFHGDYMECTMYDEDSVKRVIKKVFLTAISTQD